MKIMIIIIYQGLRNKKLASWSRLLTGINCWTDKPLRRFWSMLPQKILKLSFLNAILCLLLEILQKKKINIVEKDKTSRIWRDYKHLLQFLSCGASIIGNVHQTLTPCTRPMLQPRLSWYKVKVHSKSGLCDLASGQNFFFWDPDVSLIVSLSLM